MYIVIALVILAIVGWGIFFLWSAFASSKRPPVSREPEEDTVGTIGSKYTRETLDALLTKIEGGDLVAFGKLQVETYRWNEVVRRGLNHHDTDALAERLRVINIAKRNGDLFRGYPAGLLTIMPEIQPLEEVATADPAVTLEATYTTKKLLWKIYEMRLFLLTTSGERLAGMPGFDLSMERWQLLLQAQIDAIYEATHDNIVADRTAFVQLRTIQEEHRLYNDRVVYAVRQNPYPDDWNQAVALHLENPALEDFRVQHHLASGEYLRLAAQAFQSQNFTMAKLVLAYWNSGNKAIIRSEIGETLIADVAKLVATYEALMGVTYAQPHSLRFFLLSSVN